MICAASDIEHDRSSLFLQTTRMTSCIILVSSEFTHACSSSKSTLCLWSPRLLRHSRDETTTPPTFAAIPGIVGIPRSKRIWCASEVTASFPPSLIIFALMRDAFFWLSDFQWPPVSKYPFQAQEAPCWLCGQLQGNRRMTFFLGTS